MLARGYSPQACASAGPSITWLITSANEAVAKVSGLLVGFTRQPSASIACFATVAPKGTTTVSAQATTASLARRGIGAGAVSEVADGVAADGGLKYCSWGITNIFNLIHYTTSVNIMTRIRLAIRDLVGQGCNYSFGAGQG